MMEEDKNLKTQINELRIEEIDELREIAKPFISLMMEFRCALMEIETKLNVLNSEFALTHNRNPIQTIKTRLKQPASTGVLQLNKSKIPCRPHKACIFLSNFMFLSVLVCDSVL